jgi:methylmalonyl-CoA/ethylmalonyl-CoA epimerase
VELLAPLGPSGFLQDFLERHGEGVHHLTFRVADLRAAVEGARAAGLRVVDENYDEPAWQEAFVSPRSAHGTIVQLVQSTLSPEARRQRWPASRCPELNQS